MEENQVQIPERWESKKLGSVCKIKKGIQFNKIELSAFGMYPCINGGIEPSGYSDLWNTNENTITISEGGNSCGYVNLVKTKFWSGGHCYSLLDLGNELDNDFLYQALKGRQHLIMDLRVGSGLPNIQQKAIKEFEFLIPDDKPEQTQIAAILSKVDEAIAQTKQLIAKYSRIKTGLMQDLLTKGIDENGNIRSEATHEFKDSPLGKIPKEWDTVKLVDIGSKNTPYLKTGPFGSSLKSEHWEETGIPVITIGSLGDNDFIKENLLYISNEKADELNAYKLIDGDILFSRVAEIGRSLVIGKKNNGWVMSSNFMRLRLNTEIYNPLVLNLIIKHSSSFIRQVAQNVNESGRSVTNSKILNSFVFPKIPMVEQSKMVDGYFKIDISLNEVNKQLSKLQSLKTGLMQDLLSGKVRVNHLIKETMKA